MKKLNRKGFTLVELLAVIVILAIVVGIALTTVLPTLKKSRKEAFELTPNTAADYLEKQYQLTLIGEAIDTNVFTTGIVPMTDEEITSVQIKAAGLKPENYVLADSTWMIDQTTGRACVKLKAATRKNSGNAAGEYYDVDTEEGSSDTAQSSACN